MLCLWSLDFGEGKKNVFSSDSVMVKGYGVESGAKWVLKKGRGGHLSPDESLSSHSSQTAVHIGLPLPLG